MYAYGLLSDLTITPQTTDSKHIYAASKKYLLNSVYITIQKCTTNYYYLFRKKGTFCRFFKFHFSK